MKIKLTATITIWVNCKNRNQLDYQNNHDCGIFAFYYHSRNDFDGAHSFWTFCSSQMAQSLFEYFTLIFSSQIYDKYNRHSFDDFKYCWFDKNDRTGRFQATRISVFVYDLIMNTFSANLATYCLKSFTFYLSLLLSLC